MKPRIDKLFCILGPCILALSGCASVHQGTLNAYTSNFSSVYSQAQDLYLRSEIVAENIADRPETEGTVTNKVKDLEARKAALRARLAALDIINKYNGILSSLAIGESPANLKGQITQLQQGLTSFDVAPIAKLVQSAAPFLGVLSQGVALVEDAVMKNKLRVAITQAQRPISAILNILAEDADSLEDILGPELKRQQDPYRAQVDSLSRRFNARIKELKASSETDALLEKTNTARLSMNRNNDKPIQHRPSANAMDPTQSDLDSLTLLAVQVEMSAIEFKKLDAQIDAQHALLNTYKNTLAATKSAFIALESAVDASRIVATHDFIKQTLELKKAALQLREAK